MRIVTRSFFLILLVLINSSNSHADFNADKGCGFCDAENLDISVPSLRYRNEYFALNLEYNQLSNSWDYASLFSGEDFSPNSYCVSNLNLYFPCVEYLNSYYSLRFEYNWPNQSWDMASLVPCNPDFFIVSSAFDESDLIPEVYSDDSINASPPLHWFNSVDETESFVIIMDDPDAPGGTWIHWIVYDIPSETLFLSEDAGHVGSSNLPKNGMKHGTNSWGSQYYRGPAPPSGTHRYYFKIYALDIEELNPMGTSIVEIKDAMEGHILDQAEFMGTFAK